MQAALQEAPLYPVPLYPVPLYPVPLYPVPLYPVPLILPAGGTCVDGEAVAIEHLTRET
ncbi:hypothetical protein DIPPA_04434 [Diplonema papillatum]|nr:hypothetical protein DIPPA_04434 [Diplonema papillatum]